MPRIVAGFALVGLICAVSAGLSRPATAEIFGGSQPYTGSHSYEFAARTKRPRVTIYPRYRALSPNAKRYCRAWLAQEYRVSGPVIVPRQQCWWQ